MIVSSLPCDSKTIFRLPLRRFCQTLALHPWRVQSTIGSCEYPHFATFSPTIRLGRLSGVEFQTLRCTPKPSRAASVPPLLSHVYILTFARLHWYRGFPAFRTHSQVNLHHALPSQDCEIYGTREPSVALWFHLRLDSGSFCTLPEEPLAQAPSRAFRASSHRQCPPAARYAVASVQHLA